MTDLRITRDGLFETIQGEGYLAGTPSLFLRTAGCNLRCRWCDTPESLPDYDVRLRVFQETPTPQAVVVDVEALACAIQASHERGFRHLVITGGEPVLQKGALYELLAGSEKQWNVTVETNCEEPPSVGLRHEVHLASLSPKLHRWRTPTGQQKILQAYGEWAAFQHVQLKVVAESLDDIRRALDMIRTLRSSGRCSPVWTGVQLEHSWLNTPNQVDWDDPELFATLAKEDVRLVIQQHPAMRLK